MNTAMASFNTTVRQMTEMPQQKNRFALMSREYWYEQRIGKDRVSFKCGDAWDEVRETTCAHPSVRKKAKFLG